MEHASKPRILLVEDDPVSRAVLASAVHGLPADVDEAATLAEARDLAGNRTHDLWLIDANLPDGRGIDLLQVLRRHSATPAIVHTAANGRAELDALIAAGFLEVLVKPMTAAQLQHAIGRVLKQSPRSSPSSSPAGRKHPVWDEAAAFAAVNGQRQQAMQLRGLFLAELPAQREAVLRAFASEDIAALHGLLHRLQGSCGFVGAVRLAAAVRVLHGAPRSGEALQAFEHATVDTLSASA